MTIRLSPGDVDIDRGRTDAHGTHVGRRLGHTDAHSAHTHARHLHKKRRPPHRISDEASPGFLCSPDSVREQGARNATLRSSASRAPHPPHACGALAGRLQRVGHGAAAAASHPPGRRSPLRPLPSARAKHRSRALRSGCRAPRRCEHPVRRLAPSRWAGTVAPFAHSEAIRLSHRRPPAAAALPPTHTHTHTSARTHTFAPPQMRGWANPRSPAWISRAPRPPPSARRCRPHPSRTTRRSPTAPRRPSHASTTPPPRPTHAPSTALVGTSRA